MNLYRFQSITAIAALVVTAACQSETVAGSVAQAPSDAPKPSAKMVEAAPLQASSTQTAIPSLTGRVVDNRIEWRGRGSGPKSGLYFAAKAINSGGETAICGVQARKGVGTSRFNSRVSNSFTFVIGDQTVLRNVAYFARAASPNAMLNAPANCKGTGVPWQAEFAKMPWGLVYTGPSSFSF